ncbi:MAG: beta-lactamase family protein, partial [Verrucomicrobiaceae bacterium]|nr:beta-lactamase family protein [Verrucomicrobiaceae bacterium]
MNPRLAAALLLQLISFCLIDAAAQVRPVSGIPVPELAVLDTAMQDIMQANDIGAGVLAVMKDDTVVYRRAFGWQDEERNIPLRPDCVMRVASVTKPFTAAAIRHLVASGAISLDSQVFSGRNPESGILDYNAFGTRDARLTDITVNHLLQHRGGWDRDAPGIP